MIDLDIAARLVAAGKILPRQPLVFTLQRDAQAYALQHQTTVSRRSTTLGRAADTSGERPELRVPAPPTSPAAVLPRPAAGEHVAAVPSAPAPGHHSPRDGRDPLFLEVTS